MVPKFNMKEKAISCNSTTEAVDCLLFTLCAKNGIFKMKQHAKRK